MHTVTVKGILSAQNSMNIYRGCTHGCIYCDSRSKCYHIEHDFEDIEVKENAAELLENALRHKKKRCMIGTGAMTDPYISLETRLCNMRKCLEIINKYGFGATIHTKSSRVLRDLDLLKSINENSKCVVQMTLTTFDERLCKIIEPNVSTTHERIEVLKIMRENGIPTVVWLDPILPFINDSKKNILSILNCCKDSGVRGIMCFNMGLTLREGNREYFYKKLDEHFPGLKKIYIQLYGNSYEILSPRNNELMQIFTSYCEQNSIMHRPSQIFEYLHEFNENKFKQLNFYELLGK